MDLTQLKYFQAAARTGNITRAAAELYVSQPNLSKSITRLEEELGVPLFDHRKGKIELNDYGRMFLSSVDIAFSELSSGVQNIQRMYAASQFMLSLGCNIRGYLADNLPAFSSAHPEIGIRQLDCTTPSSSTTCWIAASIWPCPTKSWWMSGSTSASWAASTMSLPSMPTIRWPTETQSPSPS